MNQGWGLAHKAESCTVRPEGLYQWLAVQSPGTCQVSRVGPSYCFGTSCFQHLFSCTQKLYGMSWKSTLAWLTDKMIQDLQGT